MNEAIYIYAQKEMNRIGLHDYIDYLRLCTIMKMKDDLIDDKEIIQTFNISSMKEYIRTIELGGKLKFNILYYKDLEPTKLSMVILALKIIDNSTQTSRIEVTNYV